METAALLWDGEMPKSMTVGTARRNGKWKVRALITVILLIPLWVVPCLIRSGLATTVGWWAGVLFADALGAFVVGFLTNNYLLGVYLYVGATLLELLVLSLGADWVLALWLGDLIPSLVAIYFAQQLFINMGD